jgi:hypothetical protein
MDTLVPSGHYVHRPQGPPLVWARSPLSGSILYQIIKNLVPIAVLNYILINQRSLVDRITVLRA